jgi:hypothetical protein
MAEESDNKMSTSDKAVLGVCELLGLMFALPFGEDLYHGTPITNWHIFYLVIGIFFAVAGPIWPQLKTRAPRHSSTTLVNAAQDFRIWLAVLLVLFIYGVGPEVYRRATQSILQPAGGSAAGAEVPPDITQLVATLRTQLDSMKRRAENAERDLEIARHPPVSPDKTATWLELQFDSSGQPKETASSNIHWAWWKPPAERNLLVVPGLSGQASTTLLVLSFDHPIKYGEVYVRTTESIIWKSYQKMKEWLLYGSSRKLSMPIYL